MRKLCSVTCTMVSFQWVGRLPIFFAAVIFKMNEDGLRLRKSDCAGFYMTKGAQGFPDDMGLKDRDFCNGDTEDH